MKCTHLIAPLAALIAALTLNVHAQTAPASAAEHAQHHTAAAVPMADGEVRKIDRQQGKVTLKHGPIANLDMPGMTMVFKVADPKMLNELKEGDKVKFAAEKVNGAITVTSMQAAQ